MKTLQPFQFVFILLFCFACQNKITYIENKELTYIYLDSLSNENFIIKNKDRHRFVKLETTADCLIAAIQKMEFDDGKIFILDSNNKIFVFNEGGKFLNTVARIGPGPNEHHNIFEFYLDKENKRVNVIDIFKSVIFSYAYSGKLLEKKDVNRHIFKDFSQAHLLEDNTLLLMKDNSPESGYNFSLVSGKNFDRVENSVPYLFVGESHIPLTAGRILRATKPADVTFLSAFISDTIYRYDARAKRIVPDMVFKGRYRPMTKNDVRGRTLEIGSDALGTARSRNLSFGINKIAMTKEYLHFTFTTPDIKVFSVFWNMRTNRGNVNEFIIDSKMNDNILLTGYFASLIATTDDAFVSTVSAENFTPEFWEYWGDYEPVKEVLATTLEDDNPVLIFYYFE
jgi:hypothetical protein